MKYDNCTVEFITEGYECDLVKCKYNKNGICKSAIILPKKACFREDKKVKKKGK